MNELWADGLTTMIIGMGVVFTFLVITIFAMQIMSKVVAYLNKIFPEAVTQTAVVKKSSSDDTEIAIAIAACVARK